MFKFSDVQYYTRNKGHLVRPISNISCSQKGTHYADIDLFNSLLCRLRSLNNEKTDLKAALRKYLITHCLYCADEL
jgi:hypothetical protein